MANNPLMDFITALTQGGELDPMMVEHITTQLAMKAAPPNLQMMLAPEASPQQMGFAGVMSPTEQSVYSQTVPQGAAVPPNAQTPYLQGQGGGADPKTLQSMAAMLATPKVQYPPAAGFGPRPQIGNMAQLSDPRTRTQVLSLAQLLGGR